MSSNNKSLSFLQKTRNRLSGLTKYLQPGITHFIIHPSKETPELVSITPDWQSRVADYQTFLDENLKQYIDNEGIQVIGYRKLRDLFSLNKE